MASRHEMQRRRKRLNIPSKQEAEREHRAQNAPQLTRDQIKQFRQGGAGFLKWLQYYQPKIPSSKGGFEIFEIQPFQEKFIREALEMDPKTGKFRFQTIAISMPRRHSKTLLMALICLWRFTLWQTQFIVIVANSEKQATSTAYKLVKGILLNTPRLAALVGKDNIMKYNIHYPALQNEIAAVSCNESVLYGMKISLGWQTELHAAPTTGPMKIIASSLGDTENSMLLVDSTVDGFDGDLHRMEKAYLEGTDPTVYCYRLEYRDLDEALDKSPPWIDRAWLKSLHDRTLTPLEWQTQHLNQRGAAATSLFPAVKVEACREQYGQPVAPAGLAALAAGKKFVVGGGLDRAYGFSLHGDATIWTSVMKVASETSDPHYYILNQEEIAFSSGRKIKRVIQRDHENYGLKNAIIESYNTQDIHAWMVESKIPAEIIHATGTNQIPAFQEMYQIVNEGRLHFPAALDGLADEMKSFTYELKNGNPKFGSDKHHDDRAYSLCWAIFATRDEELAIYELDGVYCHSRLKTAPLCYLRRGDAILHCSRECETHQRVQEMYAKHRAARVDSELSLPEFYSALVKNRGGKIYQGL